MKEETKIEHTGGTIRLLGNKDEFALYLNDTPIQFIWLRDGNTTWRYQIGKNISEADIIQDRQFRKFVKEGQVGKDSLAKQFGYLINKLEIGEYELELTRLHRGVDFIMSQNVKEAYYHLDKHGSVMAVIATQSFLDPGVVEEYIELIKSGVKPIMVVLKAKSGDLFILDGHHKFAAYEKLRKAPKALVISKKDGQDVSKGTALELLKLAGTKYEVYKDAFINGIDF